MRCTCKSDPQRMPCVWCERRIEDLPSEAELDSGFGPLDTSWQPPQDRYERSLMKAMP